MPERGDVDRAIAIYRRIRPVTARVLNAMGQLYANKKEGYNDALKCHTQALKMQEEVRDSSEA